MLIVNQKNPGPFVIRFLEQGPDVNHFPVHEYKEPGTGGQWFNRNFTCLSEIGLDCPGCRAGMKRKERGVYNLIQRNRPIFRRDHEGKTMRDPGGNPYIDGYADAVVIANVGGPTSEMLRQADGQYQGLMSRDFVVTYSGNSFQAWNLSPAIDAQGNAIATPMSEADFQLAAAKHDLDKYMRPPQPQEAAQIVAKYGGNSGVQTTQPQGQQAPPPVPGSPQANQFLAGTPIPAGVNAFGLATGGVPPQPPTPQPAPPVYQQAPPQYQQPPQPPVPPQQAPPQQPSAAPAGTFQQ